MRYFAALLFTSTMLLTGVSVADQPEPAPVLAPIPAEQPSMAVVAPAPCPCHAKLATHAGCCEPRRHCNDNAWDGYCKEQAHWDAVWARVGTGTLLSGCEPRYTGPTCGCCEHGGLLHQFRMSLCDCPGE